MSVKTIILVLFFFMGTYICAQGDWKAKHKIGFSYNYGSQALLSLDYHYQAHLIYIEYYRKLVAKKGWGIDLMLQPQFGTSEFFTMADSVNSVMGQEIGINGGILIHKNIINDVLYLYCKLGAGPHFVSGVPDRQRDGFIFADNAIAGLMVRYKKEGYAYFGIGIRHISNAKLTSPNGGINTTMFQAGWIFMVE